MMRSKAPFSRASTKVCCFITRVTSMLMPSSARVRRTNSASWSLSSRCRTRSGGVFVVFINSIRERGRGRFESVVDRCQQVLGFIGLLEKPNRAQLLGPVAQALLLAGSEENDRRRLGKGLLNL